MIRAENLTKLLNDEGWSYKHFGTLLGVSGAYVGKLANRKTPFTEKTARRVEEVAAKPPYWLDTIHEWSSAEAKAFKISGRSLDNSSTKWPMDSTPPDTGHAQEPASRYNVPRKSGGVDFTLQSGSANMEIAAPVVAWADLEVGLMKSNREWPKEACITFRSVTEGVSDRVKCLVVNESKIPTISPGDHIAVDPVAPLEEDCVIVVKLVGGKMELRRYRALADGGWEAIAPNESPLDNVKHGLSLIGRVIGLHKRHF